MHGKSILYVSSEIIPFSPENSLSRSVFNAARYMQSNGHDVRIFIPRFGVINERRHQLHEVIRLSGINLIINDIYHPLLIKVASIPETRLQSYFIDNDEYFKRKAIDKDEYGNPFKDNDERILFFTKGVLEAVKKLNWRPDIIHVYGWISVLIPMYIKMYYKKDPIYKNTKIITSIYNNPFKGSLNKDIIKKISADGIRYKYFRQLESPDFSNLTKLVIDFSNGIIKEDNILYRGIENYIDNSNTKVLEYNTLENRAPEYWLFYTQTMSE